MKGKLPKTSPHNPRRGEIWDTILDPTEEGEMGGHNPFEPRPCVVMSLPRRGRRTVRVCVPFTGFQDDHLQATWYVVVAPDQSNGLSKVSSADASQIRALSQTRLETKRGKLGEVELRAVLDALGTVLDFQVADEVAQ